MAKKIMQFRYYGSHDNKSSYNQPSVISLDNLHNGTIFTNYLPITQIGIQTLPGTKFYLNEATTPIMVASTGIYELDLEGLSTITGLTFDYNSLLAIEQTPGAYLIIDIICEA